MQRVRTPYGEIDLLMSHDNTLIIVEVKYREIHVHESLSLRQKKRLIQAGLWIWSQNPPYPNIRWDVVLIESIAYEPYINITHIPHAFQGE